VSVLVTLSDLERREARGHIFKRIYLITLEPFDLAAEHMCGGAHFLWCQAYPLQGGGAPDLSHFGGSLLFLRTSFDAELRNLMSEGLVFRGSALSQ